MNIMTMGTAAGYVKNMALNIKWKERKEDPAKPKEGADPEIERIKKQAEEQRTSNKTNSIYGKMLSGARLSPEELEHLRENSPDNYEKALQIEKEREEYKRNLEKCTSKEDVEKLNQRKLNAFCAEAKAIANNPNIPESKKKELSEFIVMRVSAVMAEHTEFKTTPEYIKLPDKSDEVKGADDGFVREASGEDKAPELEIGDDIPLGPPDFPQNGIERPDSSGAPESGEPLPELKAPVFKLPAASRTDMPDTARIYNARGMRSQAFTGHKSGISISVNA